MLTRKISSILRVGIYLSFPFMVWKVLQLVTNSSSPIFLVRSGLIDSSFYNKGDLLLITNFQDELVKIGDLVVFKVDKNKDTIPVVHRVIKVHQERTNETTFIKFLTKGDNNLLDDRHLYPKGKEWLTKKDLIGRVCGYLPYLGLILTFSENYVFKYLLTLCVLVYMAKHLRNLDVQMY